ncbi:MAG: hypothetical protein AMS20_03195 [Gemmatimonas sp. SG8_28]|jgi:hypothetical protein|nr:MAG: hypothetical protein AMS20_03195 [Gemmatimonas sp. SG8_28]
MKRARTLTVGVVLAAGTALGSCDSGPKAGEIVAEIVTPVVELGAASFRARALEPYTIDTVAAACTGCTAYMTRVTDREVRGIVTGRFGAGPLVRVTVSDRDVRDPYSVELLELAAPDYSLPSVAGSSLRFQR